MNMPTSIASIEALKNAMKPAATNTSNIPRSSLEIFCRSLTISPSCLPLFSSTAL